MMTTILRVSYDNVGINPLSANPTKRSNTLEEFVGNLPASCLSVFNHFVGLALKGLHRLNTRSSLFFVKFEQNFPHG